MRHRRHPARCDICEVTTLPPRISTVPRPKPYAFNHEVNIVVLEVVDAAGTFFDIHNAVGFCNDVRAGAHRVRRRDERNTIIIIIIIIQLSAYVRQGLGSTVELAQAHRRWSWHTQQRSVRTDHVQIRKGGARINLAALERP